MRTRALFLLGLLVPATVGAQELSIRTWNAREGLIHSRVNAIRRDSSGYVWFATWEGASRFDGRRFVNYGSREGLPNPLVWCVAEGPGGHVWLGTHGGGIARVAATGVAVLTEPRGPRNPASHVFEIAFDRDGRMWLVTSQGLYVSPRALPDELSFERVEELGPGWFGRPLAGADGDLWFVANDELVRWRGGALVRTPLAHAGGGADLGELRAVAPRRAGGAWVAHLRALHVVELPKDGDASAVCRVHPVELGPDRSLYDVSEDAAGNLWVATSRGLLRANAAGEQWLTAAQGLPDDWVHSIARDAEGGLWIGTHQGGAAYLADSGVEHYTARSGLGDGHAVKLLALDDERWIVSMEVAGLFEIARGGVRRVAGSDRPPFDRIQREIARDAAGDWWIGTEAGVERARGPDLCLARAELVDASPGPPASANRVIGLDAEGRVLVASGDGRVFRAEPGAARFEALPFALAGHFVQRLVLDPAGNAWLSEGDKLWRARGERLEEIAPWPAAEGPVLPRVLRVDSRGWLWVGTRFGGVAYTREPGAEHPRFERVTTRQGLASDVVFALLEGRDGALYLGTGRGVQHLRPLEGSIETIAAESGIGGTWINDLAFDARGDLWVAAANGVARVPLAAPRPRRDLPRVRFTRCVVAGAEIALPIEGTIEPAGLEIGAKDSRLAFEFVAVDPVRGERLLYQTQLEALDSAWSEPSRELSARYGQLAPGEYRFEVRCVDPGAGLTGEPSSLRLQVVPPVWTRPWFLALALLAAAGLGFAAHRVRLRRELALERVRAQIASDLHDDLGAGLVQIAISSEMARRAEAREAHAVMGEVAELARGLRGSMSDLVWAVDPRHDTLADVAGRMRQFADDVLAGAGLTVEFQAQDELQLARFPLAPDRRRNLFLSFKEAVTNIARHARARHVRIELGVAAGRIRLSIQDDGSGFDPAAAHAGQGLRNLQRRARDLGAVLVVDSAPGRGTRIALDAPA